MPIVLPPEASLYIHIPFCTVLCPFCDFYKTPYSTNLVQSFVTAACTEIQAYKRSPKLSVPSIFFGGGTPSLLTKSQLSQIFTTLTDTFNIQENAECSLEANPEDISPTYLETLQNCGINRISLGIQSFNDIECQHLGRGHTVSTSIAALKAIKATPLTLSIDLIYGTQKTSLESCLDSCKQALHYDPDHISAYCLSIEENTPFHKKGITSIGQESEYEQFQVIKTQLTTHHYTHYEVCAFAKENYECIHNKRYWSFDPYIGIGPSAHSLLFPYRFSNPKSLHNYIKDPSPQINNPTLSPADPKTLMIEQIIANLRRPNGIHIQPFNQRHNTNMLSHFKSALDSATKQKLLRITPTHIQSTKKGLYLLDEVCLLFL